MTRQKNDKGAVLLTTLLIMAIMSALAVAMMSDIRAALLRSGNMSAHAQADWYMKAAEDFAKSYIETNYLTLSTIEKNTALKQPIYNEIPIEDGLMRLIVFDGTQCLPLNAVTAPSFDDDFGSDDDAENQNQKATDFGRILQRLLVDTGMADIDASNLRAAIVDWQDADQQVSNGGAEDYTYLGLTPAYRTPNSPVRTVSELRAVRGMNEDIYKLISPYLCAGSAQRQAKININTLGPGHLVLLSALLGEDEDGLAAQILQSRPPTGYEDLVSDLQTAGVDPTKVNADLFSTEPTYLWIEVDVTYRDASRTVLLEFMIDSDGLKRTYRHYGTEGRKPEELFEIKEEDQG